MDVRSARRQEVHMPIQETACLPAPVRVEKDSRLGGLMNDSGDGCAG
jgi:hypothetical protein